MQEALHDTKYVDTLPSAEQMKKEFVTAKGNGSHTSLLRLLRSGMTVAQVERYIEDKVRERYLQTKADLWAKVLTNDIFYCCIYVSRDTIYM